MFPEEPEPKSGRMILFQLLEGKLSATKSACCTPGERLEPKVSPKYQFSIANSATVEPCSYWRWSKVTESEKRWKLKWISDLRVIASFTCCFC